jgi:hypothetical protein
MEFKISSIIYTAAIYLALATEFQYSWVVSMESHKKIESLRLALVQIPQDKQIRSKLEDPSFFFSFYAKSKNPVRTQIELQDEYEKRISPPPGIQKNLL